MGQSLLNQPVSKVIWIALVGVLIVFAILAFVPVQVTHSHRSPILRSKVQVRSMVQGAVVFAGSHEDRFPTAGEWPDALIELGIIEPELLVSRMEDGDGVSFIYLPSTEKVFEGDFESRIMIYEDPKHYQEGVVVGFADTRVEVVEHEEFERMLAAQLASEPKNPVPETP